MDIKAVIAGAVSGFVSALVIDVSAWSKSNKKDGSAFDFKLAFQRWIAGAMTGGMAAMGWNATVEV